MSELHYRLTNEEVLDFIDKGLKECEKDVLLYLRTLDPHGDRSLQPSVRGIARALKYNPSSVSMALKGLDRLGYINDELGRWKFQFIQTDGIEKRVRDRLLEKLGGLKEVSTPVGRIDLLTNTEVIEIKYLSDWKAALGQVMAYSGFYPEHQKRIHLFSNKPIKPESAPQILETCSTLGVLVSFEEIKVDVIEEEPELEPERELFEVSGMPIAPYREWLKRKSESLPIKPALIGKWIQSMAVKLEVQQDFCDHLKSKNKINVSPSALVVENLPKAYVDMTPTEQVDFLAAIAAASSP